MARNTGAAGIAEAGYRFGDEGPSGCACRRSIRRCAPGDHHDGRGFRACPWATCARAVGDFHALHNAAPNGGAWVGSRGDSPPGALLGPIAGGVGMRKGGEPDPDKLYPLQTEPEWRARLRGVAFCCGCGARRNCDVSRSADRVLVARGDVSFDLSDEFARELTHRTSSPKAKADFLAATFKRRTAMAANVSSQQMRAAQVELPSQLDALWADTRYRRRELRRIVFSSGGSSKRRMATGAPPRRQSRRGFANVCRAARPTLTATKSSPHTPRKPEPTGVQSVRITFGDAMAAVPIAPLRARDRGAATERTPTPRNATTPTPSSGGRTVSRKRDADTDA